MQQPDFITVEEAGALLGVSVATVRRWCAKGKIPAERAGRQWLIRESDLQQMRRPRRRSPQSLGVDVGAAFRQVFQLDVKENWVPDPLRFEDHRSAEADVLAEAAGRIDQPGPFDPPSVVDVAKTPFLSRAASLLSIEDRVAYHAAVSSIIERVEGVLHSMDEISSRTVVFSARASSKEDELLRPGTLLWLEFKEEIEKTVDAGYQWMLRTDIAGYYDNIQHRLLFGDFDSYNPDGKASRALKQMLPTWSTAPGVGIPQGPDASRPLGNMYLIPVDQAMVGGSWIYFRYMDDIRVFGRTRRDVITGARQLEHECRRRGLVLSADKTELLVGDDAKNDLNDPEMQRARYLFDKGQYRKSRPLLRNLLRSALIGNGHIRDKRAKFSLWRLALLRDHYILKKVLRFLEDLAPIASIVASYLRPFLARRWVQRELSGFLTDSQRNLSPFLSAWVLAAVVECPGSLPADWIAYARDVAQDRNAETYHRVVATNVLSLGRQAADLAWLRDSLAKEFDPELARGYMVALFRGGGLDKATTNAAVLRLPVLRRTVSYLQGRTTLPSLIVPGVTVPVRRGA